MDPQCTFDMVQHWALTLSYTRLERSIFQASVFSPLLTLPFLCSSEGALLPHLLGLKDDGVRGCVGSGSTLLAVHPLLWKCGWQWSMVAVPLCAVKQLPLPTYWSWVEVHRKFGWSESEVWKISKVMHSAKVVCGLGSSTFLYFYFYFCWVKYSYPCFFASRLSWLLFILWHLYHAISGHQVIPSSRPVCIPRMFWQEPFCSFLRADGWLLTPRTRRRS